MENKPKWLWKTVDFNKYQFHVTISTIDSTTESEDADERIVYMEDLEKENKFKDNFKNWTSGNKDIDEFIQQSQLNAVHWNKYLEWIPFEKFQKITYIAEGGFGKIYSAKWPGGHIIYWDIENQKWYKDYWSKYVLKSLNNSSNISSDFFNEIKSHLQIHLFDVVQCYGITQNPNTKEYMMVLFYCDNGNLRNYLNKSENYIGYESKINKLRQIARGLLDIHIAEKVHKDFHSGNILNFGSNSYISDLGMCQPANKKSVKEEGIYGVLPYMSPEVLRGHQYTKAADIYSFGIIMNEFLSEEIPYGDISHDEFLAVKICKGQRPKISEDVPRLLADLIVKCWDAEIENRPTAKELYKIFKKWNDEIVSSNLTSEDENEDNENNESNEGSGKNSQYSEICNQIKKSIYTSRLLNFKNLPKPVNSSDFSSFQFNSDAKYAIQSTLANPISECLDIQLSESELNEICQDDENNIES
ncbi:unnamed protein product [Rhizophagus irregularis]|nr:unnamed protein product [Rhizophagus irregularis]